MIHLLSIKSKLALSYSILILLALLVSIWNIYHFAVLGEAVNEILTNNYNSIVAAARMKESLQIQDQEALLGKRVDKVPTADFWQAFNVAKNNITEVGEARVITDIGEQYQQYNNEWQNFVTQQTWPTANARTDAYIAKLAPHLTILQVRLTELSGINQQAMIMAKENARHRAWQAQVSTSVLTLVALMIAILLSWRFTHYVVNPLALLTAKARQIGQGELGQRIGIFSGDEIGLLAAEFNRMAARLSELRQSDYWKLLMEQKKADAVIEAIYEPIIVTNAQGRIVKLNYAAIQILQEGRKLSVANINQDNSDDFTLSGFQAGEQIIKAVREAVAFQKPIHPETETLLLPGIVADGAAHSYRLRTTPMRDTDGQLIGTVTVLEDITAINEVGRLKTDFITIASQKMRLPLLSLQMALYALLAVEVGNFNEQQQDLLHSAYRDTEKLDTLIQDLLILAEIASGAQSLTLESYRPVVLVRDAILRNQCLAETKQITLQTVIPDNIANVAANAEAVKRIFHNLLTNALHYTDYGGQIVITAEEHRSYVAFSVTDNGKGIAPEYLPNLFSRFVYQPNANSDGTGLGLAIVKKLVEAQGGQVSVKSRLQEGTTVTFSLPVAAPPQILENQQ